MGPVLQHRVQMALIRSASADDCIFLFPSPACVSPFRALGNGDLVEYATLQAGLSYLGRFRLLGLPPDRRRHHAGRAGLRDRRDVEQEKWMVSSAVQWLVLLASPNGHCSGRGAASASHFRTDAPGG